MLKQLILRALDVSKAVAQILDSLEKYGPLSATDAQAQANTLVKQYWKKPIVGDRRRAARILAQAWSDTVELRSARRPDVLGLTCELMTNPSTAVSRDVARFAIALALRSLYNVQYGTEALAAIRASHAALSERFEEHQRRRIRKDRSVESLIIDLACMEGAVSRSLSGANLTAYYRAFTKSPLGVTGTMRAFSPRQEWPELRGKLPDLGAVIKLAFAQPTCVPGLDEVVQGLLASVPESNDSVFGGGLVTLIAGPPGSGKTSLSLALASRMAELGSIVSYIATEEPPYALEAKMAAVVDAQHLTTALLGSRKPRSSPSNFAFVDGSVFGTLGDTVNAINDEIDIASTRAAERHIPGMYLAFPRVVVIDSLTALMLKDRGKGTNDGNRRGVTDLLKSLRVRGICVVLVGGVEDCRDDGLAYLVDNVFELGAETKSDADNPRRVLDIQKTRLQTSHRGRHVFHLSRTEGCIVCPSLHSVMRNLRDARGEGGEPQTRATLWLSGRVNGKVGHSSRLMGRGLSLVGRSQTLVYGPGSTGKATFALNLAFEPRWEANELNVREYLRNPQYRRRLDLRAVNATKVLVISFLYGRDYYQRIAARLLASRFEAATPNIDRHLSVLALYPGFLDAETLVARIARSLKQARYEGLRFSSVVIDGIHNMQLQFPVLSEEPLLWPTLHQLLRAEGVDAVSTFTHFEAQGLSSKDGKLGRQPMVTDTQQLFSNLLVGSCDYSFILQRVERGRGARVEVAVGSSLHAPDLEQRYVWNAEELTLSAFPREAPEE